jgi:4-hydroxy-tetrahydrodipicolinate reductase
VSTKVAVAGASGRLGGPVCAAVAAADDLELVARIAPSLVGTAADAFGAVDNALVAEHVDVLVDVTRPDRVEPHVGAAIAAGVPVVLCTTGFGDEAASRLDAAAQARGVPLFYAPNFAVTAVLMMRLAVEAARHVPDCEIVEEHASTKLDRPSGTALHTARLIAEATSGEPPPISSLRLPGLVANQSVIFGAQAQTLEIRHVTTSREAFVPGVLLAVRRVRDLPPGLTIGLDRLLFED